MSRYVVKFIDLVEQTINESAYSHLWDAIKVAKETDIGPDRLCTPAIPDHVFDEQLLSLLTNGFIYVGRKTTENPNGFIMIQLLKELPDRQVPVFSALWNSNVVVRDLTPQSNSITEMYTTMQFISPVAESNMSDNWDDQFTQTKEAGDGQ